MNKEFNWETSIIWRVVLSKGFLVQGCIFCKIRRGGASVQCTHRNCHRSYHGWLILLAYMHLISCFHNIYQFPVAFETVFCFENKLKVTRISSKHFAPSMFLRFWFERIIITITSTKIFSNDANNENHNNYFSILRRPLLLSNARSQRSESRMRQS